MVAMPNVTFAVYRDGKFLGNFKTDQFGEILLTNVEPGTYRAFEVDTGDANFVFCTATVGNPEELAGNLLGRELVQEKGLPSENAFPFSPLFSPSSSSEPVALGKETSLNAPQESAVWK